MPSVYGQMTKISNASGRSDYMQNPEKQEEVVLFKSEMKYSWQFHSDFEKQHSNSDKQNNEAREVIVPVDNSLYNDRKKLEQVCDSLVKNIVGENHDYEYAVHWNKAHTNLHIHILFSERENVLEREPKVYAKDIWQDRDTHKLAKANAPNAELVHRKGEIQKDKDGNIKYKDEPFKAKDVRFKNHSFIQEKNEIIARTLAEYGYQLRVQTKDSPYLSQRKEYKGASKDYIENCRAYNSAVRKYNEAVENHIQLEPQREPIYIEQRAKIESAVKSENSKEKKISHGAIAIIDRLGEIIRDVVNKIRSKIKALSVTENFNEWYEQNQAPLIDQLQKLNQSEAKLSISSNLLAQAKENVAEKKALLEEAKELKREEEAKETLSQIEPEFVPEEDPIEGGHGVLDYYEMLENLNKEARGEKPSIKEQLKQAEVKAKAYNEARHLQKAEEPEQEHDFGDLEL